MAKSTEEFSRLDAADYLRTLQMPPHTWKLHLSSPAAIRLPLRVRSARSHARATSANWPGRPG